MSKPVIEVKSLSKRYKIGVSQGGKFLTLRDRITAIFQNLNRSREDQKEDFWALRDVSFEVQPGEVLGIIGANGAGKSTLLKIVSRITEPTQGEIVLRGRVASLLEVGTGFHPELTGRENIFLNGIVLGMKRAEVARRFDEIVAFSGVEKFLESPVKRYSSGMYVRLAFAVAAHLEPDILIVDEVLAVGDAEFQKRCLGKMEEVARMGRTVLFVSHSMHAIEKLCSRVARFGGGRLLESGSPAPVVQNYLKAVSERRNVFPLRDSETGIVLESARSGLDSDNSPNGSPLCHGCDGFLEFVFSCPKDLGIAALHLGIYSDRGVLLALLDSSNGKRAFDWSRGRHCVRCMISQFPLLAGRYDCNLAIVRSGHAIAAFPLSFDLQVISGNATNNPKAGFISLDFRWEEVLVDSPA